MHQSARIICLLALLASMPSFAAADELKCNLDGDTQQMTACIAQDFRRADAVYRSTVLREDRRRLRHNLAVLAGRLDLAKAARESEQRARGLAAPCDRREWRG